MYDQGRIVAGAQVLFRRLPLGWTMAYVPKGPLIDLGHRDACDQLFVALHRLCRSRRSLLLKIEPDWFESDAAARTLTDYGFSPSSQTVQPRRTILIDVTPDREEMLNRLKSKTRYNIRLAERKGVMVQTGSPADVETFSRLMAVTGERDGFGVHSPDYYAHAYDLFVRQEMGRLFIACYENQPIAAVMALACGHKAWNMYSASGNEHRDKMPNYVLQWAAMLWAQGRGCQSYDLWGVPDQPEAVLEAQFAERNDGMWGLYRFKRGFGGQVVRYAGAFDLVYNRLFYQLYYLALRLRKAQPG